MKFSKDNIKKGMAGGLIALMIASNVACDKKQTSVNDWMKNEQFNGHSVIDMDQSDAMKIMNHDMSNPVCAEYRALPLKTLKKMGYVEIDNDGHRVQDLYALSTMCAYADIKNNQIALIVEVMNATSGAMARYRIKYDNVKQEDIETFSSLRGDVRIGKFIQGIDECYKANVEKAIGLWRENGIAHMWVEDFDPSSFDISVSIVDENGLQSYSYNLISSSMAGRLIDNGSITQDELRENIGQSVGPLSAGELGDVYVFNRDNDDKMMPDVDKISADIIISPDNFVVAHSSDLVGYRINEDVKESSLN